MRQRGRKLRRGSIRSLLLMLPVLLASSVCARADTVNAAVAANFTAAIGQLAPLFERRTGHQLVPSFGATGQLYAQARNGAPFDVFLAADEETAQRLVGDGLAPAASKRVYARGRLALWSASPGYIDAHGEVLRSGDFKYLAIANPKTAPYGRAAMETLVTLGLAETLQPRLVSGQNIAQAQQFVASGNAPLGLIALAQILALPESERGSHWLVPEHFHRPINQAAVVLRRAQNPIAAQAFLSFLTSPEAVATIRSLGYETDD